MREIWKTIDGYPDYIISNLGRVYSNRRNRMLKISLDQDGYPRVNLSHNNYWVNKSIHRLVAFAFVPGYFEGAVVNHKDGIKSNCKDSNLEWITQGDNIRHAADVGLTPRRIRIIETGDTFMYISSCAKHIGGNPDSILKCLNGTRQSYKGYHFEYVNKGIK